ATYSFKRYRLVGAAISRPLVRVTPVRFAAQGHFFIAPIDIWRIMPYTKTKFQNSVAKQSFD
ncbi:MAG: hypothetical protein ACI3V2_10685, partial [Faecousia sp.]